MKLVGRGFAFDDLKLGFRFRTHRRTITEADLAAFINLSWLTEELFAVATTQRAIKRPVPGALVYSFAEGLLLPTMQDTGLAFLNATLDVKAPTVVGDTIHVECEVIEHRLASKGDRGLVRFANKVINQRGETVLEYNPLRLLKEDMIERVDHIVLTTRDKDACIRFYSDVLGMKLEKFQHPDRGAPGAQVRQRRKSTCTSGARNSRRARTSRCRDRWICASSPPSRWRK